MGITKVALDRLAIVKTIIFRTATKFLSTLCSFVNESISSFDKFADKCSKYSSSCHSDVK